MALRPGSIPRTGGAARRLRRAALAALLAFAAACAGAPRHQAHLLPVISSPIPLPPGFLPPVTPADNPLTVAKAELGRRLFYDKRLSFNRTQSCASCHQQRRAFTDGRTHAIGSTGQEHYRNTMTLANAGWRRPLTWADPNTLELEQQVLVPLTNEKPVELGMNGRFDELIERLRSEPLYRDMFAAAFPGQQDPFSVANVARALASFERTLISAGSPYDRLERLGETQALSDAAWRGMRLFFSPRLACSSCHGGPDFGTPAGGASFQNNGTIGARAVDQGLADKTHHRRDRGKFRVPTLRNVAVTGPYMHDGSASSLDEVIDDYAGGGHAARASSRSPGRGVAVKPFRISEADKRDLIAFLDSLTDPAFLDDPRFSDPWK